MRMNQRMTPVFPKGIHISMCSKKYETKSIRLAQGDDQEADIAILGKVVQDRTGAGLISRKCCLSRLKWSSTKINLFIMKFSNSQHMLNILLRLKEFQYSNLKLCKYNRNQFTYINIKLSNKIDIPQTSMKPFQLKCLWKLLFNKTISTRAQLMMEFYTRCPMHQRLKSTKESLVISKGIMSHQARQMFLKVTI
jgi:hypothetical protein